MTLRTKSSAMSRRNVLMSLAAAPMALHTAVRGQEAQTIKICQSTALSGPLGDLGQALHQGARACFAEVNAKGGVHGRKIELSVLDDGYEAKRALANLDKFLADRDSFALFNWFGTPIVAATLPKVIESGLPFLAPYTGALLARPKNARNVFNIRASYPDEAEQLVRHLATIGIKRIGIAYQNNAFGKEVYDAARIAMDKHQLRGSAVATVENSGDDAAAAAAKIVEGNPEAVLVGLAGKPTVDFVKAMRTLRRGMPLYALSVMGSAATLRDLGDAGVGIAVSQVVPLPTSVVMPIVRQFQQGLESLRHRARGFAPGAGRLHQRPRLPGGAEPGGPQPFARALHRIALEHQAARPGRLRREFQPARQQRIAFRGADHGRTRGTVHPLSGARALRRGAQPPHTVARQDRPAALISTAGRTGSARRNPAAHPAAPLAWPRKLRASSWPGRSPAGPAAAARRVQPGWPA